jgi:hypothetical protein
VQSATLHDYESMMMEICFAFFCFYLKVATERSLVAATCKLQHYLDWYDDVPVLGVSPISRSGMSS